MLGGKQVGLVYILFTTSLYGISITMWLFHCFVLPLLDNDPDRTWGSSDVQVRILTIRNEELVRKTATAAQRFFDDIHVVSETELKHIPAEVHVVPNDFECKAECKGRALEWARQNIDNNREYTLYLDEDTIVEDFCGLPDSDLVQFSEMPSKTSSLITYLTDVFRIGYQTEQRSFGVLSIPLYCWGGGVAVRHSVENEVTWDYPSITEDTNFVWRAADEINDFSYSFVNDKMRNQSPLGMIDLINQRKRWASGTLQDAHLLPKKWRYYVYFRLVVWAFSPILFLNGLVIALFGIPVLSNLILFFSCMGQIALMFFISFRGVWRYRTLPTILAIPLTPMIATVNSIGSIYAIIKRSDNFHVTPKSSATIQKNSQDSD